MQAIRKKGNWSYFQASDLNHDAGAGGLFGYKKGAFTGATCDRLGKLSQVGEGILIFEELDGAAWERQEQLLSLLGDGTYYRLGDDASIQRFPGLIIATLNQDPEKLLRNDKLRQDLFKRFEGRVIYIPPLRDRPEDVDVLIRGFTKLAREAEDLATLPLETMPIPRKVIEAVLAVLENDQVPLEGIVKNAFHIARARGFDLTKRFTPEFLLAFVQGRRSPDRDEIVKALQATRGNLSEAARQLSPLESGTEKEGAAIKRLQRLVASLGISAADYAG
jgi:transcriptional regulator with GAF, ATPase, and Fis domain